MNQTNNTRIENRYDWFSFIFVENISQRINHERLGTRVHETGLHAKGNKRVM